MVFINHKLMQTDMANPLWLPGCNSFSNPSQRYEEACHEKVMNDVNHDKRARYEVCDAHPTETQKSMSSIRCQDLLSDVRDIDPHGHPTDPGAGELRKDCSNQMADGGKQV